MSLASLPASALINLSIALSAFYWCFEIIFFFGFSSLDIIDYGNFDKLNTFTFSSLMELTGRVFNYSVLSGLRNRFLVTDGSSISGMTYPYILSFIFRMDFKPFIHFNFSSFSGFSGSNDISMSLHFIASR